MKPVLVCLPTTNDVRGQVVISVFFSVSQSGLDWRPITLTSLSARSRTKKIGKNYADYSTKSRVYTWSQGETLPELLSRKEEIMARHDAAMENGKKRRKNIPLIEMLADVLDEEDDTSPC